MADSERLNQLFKLWYNQHATEEEQQELLEKLGEENQAGKLEGLMKKAYEGLQGEPFFSADEKNKISDAILGKTTAKIFTLRRISVAASIILALGVGGYLFFFKKSSSIKPKKEIVAVTNDVEAPKRTKATIELADGRIVSIDSLTSIDQSNVKLSKTADGKIVYDDSHIRTAVPGTAFNVLTNPRGSKVIDMTLSDGSHVWLNAASSISFPIAFTGKERKVFITGEAYFEIVHNTTKPFIVNANNKGSIEVLGTHFNVNAYEDGDALRTTLLEGKIMFTETILSIPSDDATILSPGQQAVLQNSKVFTQKSVDVDAVMAWKNGQFVLKGTDLAALMRQIARWYDVDVVFNSAVPEKKFGGSVNRDVNLSTVLQALKEYGVVCKLDGKKLIVE